MTTPSPTPEPTPASKKQRPQQPVGRPGTRARLVTASDDEPGGGRFLIFNVLPSWIVSLLAHLILVIAATLYVIPSLPLDKTVSFEAGTSPTASMESVDISLDSLDSGEPLESELADSAAAEVIDTSVAAAPEATVDVSAIMAGTDSNLDMQTVGEVSSLEVGSETGLRSGEGKAAALKKYGGSAGSESAVELALKWIVDHQLPDGGWSLNHRLANEKSRHPGTLTARGGVEVQARRAATALALLPLLGHGNTHLSGKYKDAVSNGLAYLMKEGQRAGKGLKYWEAGGRMYSHALVAITFCEAYAMTKDEALAPYAQATIWYSESVQDLTGGGWRYMPNERGDTSVVGWQMMALKSATATGLDVRSKTKKLVKRYLDAVGNPELGVFGYLEKPSRPMTRDRACTAIGLLCRMYLGAEKDANEIRNGIDYLVKLGPDIAPTPPPTIGAEPAAVPSRQQRVTSMYYNYYATQVMKQYGGEKWKSWNAKMREFLIDQQVKSGPDTGSWMFGEHHAEKGGRLYVTSLACMTLEVYYRFLPLYSESILEDDFPLD